MEPPKKRGRPKKVVAEREEAANDFVITITIGQDTYTGRGVTALDALRDIPMPELITTGNLVITHGDKRKEMLYPTMQLKRIFNIFHQEVLINDIVFGLS